MFAAMGDFDLPLLHHSFFYEPPYFPGYRDIWGNVVIARAAAHPWGAQRLLAYLTLSGSSTDSPTCASGSRSAAPGGSPHGSTGSRDRASTWPARFRIVR